MSARRPLLVTGTDTGIGKTFVTAGIAAALSARGVRVGVAKPVETGCRLVDGELYPEDAATLVAAAAAGGPLARVCPYRFPDPLAPSIAAARAGSSVDVDALCTTLDALASDADVLLVEGAGGLLVPITERFSYADLARRLDARVLVVVGSRLGALNHALLTLEALAARGIRICGYVLNRLVPPGDHAADTNAAALARVATVRALGELPWIANAGELLAALRRDETAAEARATLAMLAERHVDLKAIAGAT
jgi:dethiobiotin synthetase